MARSKLTQRKVETIRPPKDRKKIVLSDGPVQLHVYRASSRHPEGRKVFYIRLRELDKTGKQTIQRLQKVGEHPFVKLADAREKARKMMVEERRPLSHPNITFNQFIDHPEFVTAVRNTRTKPGRADDFLRNLKHTFSPLWGTRPLRQIDETDVRNWQAEALGRLKPSTVKRQYRELTRVFTEAVSRGIIWSSPVPKDLKWPRMDDMEKKHFTEYEVERILSALERWEADPDKRLHPEWVPPYCRFMLHTGARRREAMKLRWMDIQPRRTKDGTRCRVAVLRGENNKAGRTREVRLNDTALAALEGFARLQGIDNAETVYGLSEALVIGERAPFKAFNRLSAMAGLERINSHAFRHTFASRLVNSGTSIRIAQRILGHSSITTTEGYLHTQDEDAYEALESLSY